MRFDVRGADRESGRNRKVRVKAADAAEAERKAAAAGLLVASVTPSPVEPAVAEAVVVDDAPPPEPEAHDDRIAGFDAEDDQIAGFDAGPAPAAESAPRTVDYAIPQSAGRTPEFRELGLWAGLLITLSRVVLALGLLIFVVGLALGLYALVTGRGLGAALGTPLSALLSGLVVVLTAAPAAVIGHSADALRQHVRRHWHR